MLRFGFHFLLSTCKLFKILQKWSHYLIVLSVFQDASVFAYLSRQSIYWKNLYVRDKLAIVFGNLSYFSASLVLTTLVTFISVSIFVLKELRGRMNFIYKNQSKMNPLQLSLELEKWRQHHQLACSFIDNINVCFGPCLLVNLIYAISVLIIQSSVGVVKYEFGKGMDVISTVNGTSRLFW